MSAAATLTLKNRIESIDYLRGVVMVIMAIDHVRDFFHRDSFYFSPTDITQTTPALFFTRWITHLCAPTFIFLAGTSAYFIMKRNSREYTSFFLLTRGLWLIALQLTLIRFAWNFDPLFRYNSSTIISTIGFCMILLALLIHLNIKTILLIGLAIVVGHNALGTISFPPKSIADILWTFLFSAGKLYDLGNEYSFQFLYPIVPWTGVMALGYCLGQLYDETMDSAKRKKILLQLSAMSLLAFLALRFINSYGDPVPWSTQPSLTCTVMSFLNLAKYPPSLLFILITLGISLLVLALLEGSNAKAIVFGKVSLFYYVMHLFVIHLFAAIVVISCGYRWETMVFVNAVANGSPELLKENFGFGLSEVYLIWLTVILVLYPLCTWWNSVKIANKGKWWVSYV
ncbi:membrane protein [Cytophagales bacterium WSM2-2]|nr:membrane protein [Cytophagales bacterium WSM2-2]